LAKYAEMDRYNERYDTITLKQESLRSIIQVIEDDICTSKFNETNFGAPDTRYRCQSILLIICLYFLNNSYE